MVATNVSFLFRTLASVSSTLNSCCALVNVVCFFLSFGFVAFFAISIVVVVVGKKKDKKETIANAIAAAIVRSHL